jgi:tRNA A-37 threonylcarbamoyl transferase component Bud32
MPERPPRSRQSASASGVAAADQNAPEKLVGKTLADRYRLTRPIGSGGMGTVFLGEHVLIHKPIAVKVLSPDYSSKTEEVERFLQEARAASRIRQENVVDITDFGISREGHVFLVMEYLEGEDLSTTSEREGALPWRRAVRMILQIAEALAAAHAQGVIHRDMKPENCFRIRRGNDPDFIKVLDFGIAKIIEEDYDYEQPSSTGSGLLGTPEYVAPELVRGIKPDHRVDIYAVGVIFYRLLTGKLPIQGDSFMATLTAHLMQAPTPPSQVAPEAQIPAEVEAVVMHALEKEQDRRHPTIAEFIRELNAAVAAIDGPAAQEKRRGVHPQVVLGVVVALLLIFAAVLWVVVQKLGSQDQAPTIAAAEPPAPAPGPTAPPPVQAEPPAKAEPAKVEPAKAEPAPPTKAEPPPVATDDATPDEPPEPEVARPGKKTAPRSTGDVLSAGEFAAKMLPLSGKVRSECSQYALRKMSVTIEAVVAADGKVKSVEPTGSQAGSTLGNCVAKVVKATRFRKAGGKSTHTHTFTM